MQSDTEKRPVFCLLTVLYFQLFTCLSDYFTTLLGTRTEILTREERVTLKGVTELSRYESVQDECYRR